MANFEEHPLYPDGGVALFIAAGPLKEATQLEPFMEIEDPLVVPVLTSGGWVKPEWPGNATNQNPQDFVYYPERGMAGNCRGLPGSGVEGMRHLREPIKRLSDKGIKTIIQVTNLPQERALDVIPYMAEEAAALEPTAVEINLSCPNGKDDDGNFHPPLCNNADESAEVMSVSRRAVGNGVCLGGKDSPHATSLESGVDANAVISIAKAVEPFIDFWVGINTIGAQPFPELVCGGGKGGMSGPVVVPIAREWLQIARAALNPDIPILSCGGVDSQNADVEVPWRLDNGAMLVGGAQEFFRATNPARLAERWAQRSV